MHVQNTQINKTEYKSSYSYEVLRNSLSEVQKVCKARE